MTIHTRNWEKVFQGGQGFSSEVITLLTQLEADLASLVVGSGVLSVASDASGTVDVNGTASDPTVGLHALAGGSTGPTGDGTHVPVVTIDKYGRVTALTSAAITAGSGTVTSVTAGDGSVTVAGTATDPTVAVHPDGSTLEVGGGALRVKDSGITSAKIADGAIVNADVNAAAAIAYSKLALAASVALSDWASGVLDTDGTLAANSDVKVASQKAVKSYVDAVAQGLSPKTSVRVASAAALPANTYLAGVITVTATGTLTVDGKTVALNDRLLVKDEATQANNGIYKCTTAGAVGVAAVLTRATDSDTGAKIVGSFVFVEDGTANASSGWVNTNTAAPTIGTTAVTFTQFSGAGEITAGTALAKSGNTLSVAAGGITEGLVTLADVTTLNVSSTAHGLAPKSPADATQFLNGAATPAFAAVKDSDLAVTDVTTNNATSSQHGFVKKLSGAATDYFAGDGNYIALPVQAANTVTLTNKRVTKRTGTVASSATPTINTDNVDFYSITALAAAITSFTTNLSGTPTEGQTLWLAITDNGTARAITWGASFEASGNVALPTTTVVSTRLDVGFVWNTATSKWRCVATA